MTMRYAHLALDHKRNAMESLGTTFSLGTSVGTMVETEKKRLSVCDDNPLILLVPKRRLELLRGPNPTRP